MNVTHVGDAEEASAADIIYMKDGISHRVRARHAVLACYHMMIPHLCPELPEKQKDALAHNIKLPLVYTNVLIRNWTSLKRAEVNGVYCPGSYFSHVRLDVPVILGAYQHSKNPSEPILLRMVRAPTALIGLAGIVGNPF